MIAYQGHVGGLGFVQLNGFVDDHAEAGIYTWLLAEDRLYGDTAVADLFGLDPELTVQGLPISAYIERVHGDDKALLAELITKAIKDRMPYSAEYRVKNTLDEFEMVIAVGRCFRDATGDPALYSGIIYPVSKLA